MASQCCRFRPRARGLGSSVVFVAENRMQFRSMKSSVQFTSCIFFFFRTFFPHPRYNTSLQYSVQHIRETFYFCLYILLFFNNQAKHSQVSLFHATHTAQGKSRRASGMDSILREYEKGRLFAKITLGIGLDGHPSIPISITPILVDNARTVVYTSPYISSTSSTHIQIISLSRLLCLPHSLLYTATLIRN